jgi:hypothetical protein
MESRQPLILLTCDGTATFPWVWSYLGEEGKLAPNGLLWCSCGEADCSDAGKHPLYKQGLIERGHNDATIDEKTIRQWWRRWPYANIGWRPGPNQFGLDVDARAGGVGRLRVLCDQHGELPLTPQAHTGSGSGSSHYWLTRTAEAHFSSSKGSDPNHPLGPGLDIKTETGYLVAPPSLHVSGQRCTWLVEADIENTPIAAAPPWLIKLLTEHSNRAGHNGKFMLQEDTSGMVSGGGRNPELFGLGRSLRAQGASAKIISAAPTARNSEYPEPKTPKELNDIIEHVLTYKDRADFRSDNGDGPPKERGPAIVVENAEQAIESNAEYLSRPAIVEKLYYIHAISIGVGGKHEGKSTAARTEALTIATQPAKGEKRLLYGREVEHTPVIYAASEDEYPTARMELLRMGWNPGVPLRMVRIAAPIPTSCSKTSPS